MEGDEQNRDKTCRFLGVNGASRDLMHKFMKRSRSPTENVGRESEEKEKLELSLGLSTNGRFGVDLASKKMRRSSSVSNILLIVDGAGNGGGHQARGVELGGHAPLVRTCSLPPDAHGWRRREELDYEGRIMTEKLKNVDNGDGRHADGNEIFDAKMTHDGFEKLRSRQLPKASIESMGLQCQPVKGTTQTTTTESSCARGVPTVSIAGTDEALLKNALVDMPYVATKGFGPNHKKIEGFLYRYKRGEELKIVCVCHGMFLSPAEFVKHGGGGEVAYPLKHIVVNPFPLY